ncbi:MAG: O-methyltransferase [Nanoarchaeota archaeon]
MFAILTPEMKHRMRALELRDQEERACGDSINKRLRQIPPSTGKFLAFMAACSPRGKVVEIGTSGGYSTLWISLTGKKILTYEIDPHKARIAKETFKLAKVEDRITLIKGDALKKLRLSGISFCFLDAEKEIYTRCYDLLIPRMMRGGVLVADNVLSHNMILKPFVDHVLRDNRVDALVISLDNGLLLCRKK